MSNLVDNRAIWERPEIVAEYADHSFGLHPSESAVFDRYAADIIGKDVLDLGIGCGRTTAWLGPKASRYVGLDYSHEMVAISKERFAGRDVRWGDARDLSAFAEQTFDFVLFSFNGIDCVGHEDRHRILHEVHRVLRPGGVFTFSSHNLSHALDRSAFRETFRFGFFSSGYSKNLLAVTKYVRRASVRLGNHLRNAKKEQRGEGFALLNDPAHDFLIVGYNIQPEAQVLQLRESGFHGKLEIFDPHGQPITGTVSTAPWLLYVVRK